MSIYQPPSVLTLQDHITYAPGRAPGVVSPDDLLTPSVDSGTGNSDLKCVKQDFDVPTSAYVSGFTVPVSWPAGLTRWAILQNTDTSGFVYLAVSLVAQGASPTASTPYAVIAPGASIRLQSLPPGALMVGGNAAKALDLSQLKVFPMASNGAAPTIAGGLLVYTFGSDS